jgi:hypothetical protein
LDTCSVRDKVRIIALYILYRDGVPDEDRKRLYQHARLGMPEVDAVNNLVRLGQEVAKESSKKRKPVFKQTMADDAYDISRYQPAVKLMLEVGDQNKLQALCLMLFFPPSQDHFAGRLDKNAFPFIGTPSASSSGAGSLRAETARNSPAMAPATSLRSARPRWTGAARSRAAEPRQRVIVFVAGGMTYSEIRTAYQVSNAHNKDVYIGQCFVTCSELVSELCRLLACHHARSVSRGPNSPRSRFSGRSFCATVNFDLVKSARAAAVCKSSDSIPSTSRAKASRSKRVRAETSRTASAAAASAELAFKWLCRSSAAAGKPPRRIPATYFLFSRSQRTASPTSDSSIGSFTRLCASAQSAAIQFQQPAAAFCPAWYQAYRLCIFHDFRRLSAAGKEEEGSVWKAESVIRPLFRSAV